MIPDTLQSLQTHEKEQTAKAKPDWSKQYPKCRILSVEMNFLRLFQNSGVIHSLGCKKIISTFGLLSSLLHCGEGFPTAGSAF